MIFRGIRINGASMNSIVDFWRLIFESSVIRLCHVIIPQYHISVYSLHDSWPLDRRSPAHFLRHRCNFDHTLPLSPYFSCPARIVWYVATMESKIHHPDLAPPVALLPKPAKQSESHVYPYIYPISPPHYCSHPYRHQSQFPSALYPVL